MEQYQIVYVSKSMLSKEIDLRTTEIQRILEVSRKWNSENDITGALMFGEGYFAQVLEGPPSILKSTFGFIACDERHRNVRLLECGPVLKRASKAGLWPTPTATATLIYAWSIWSYRRFVRLQD